MTIDRWIGIAGLAIGILATLFAVWSHKKQAKRKKPTFVTLPSRTPIAQSILTQIAGFELLFEKRPVGAEGITAVHVYFWNDGELPITDTDVIEPYTVSFPAGIAVLTAWVVKVSRDALKISTTKATVDGIDTVTIHFSVIEAGDGFELQLIYDGSPTCEIKFGGSCIGSRRPTVLAPEAMYFKSKKQRFIEVYAPVIVTLIVASCSGAFFGILYLLSRWLKMQMLPLYILGGVTVVAAVSLVVSILYENFKRAAATTVPPEIRRF